MAFKDPEKRRAYMRQYAADKREKHRQIIREAKARPCADCGVEYPYYTMTFDHLGNKTDTISKRALNPNCTTQWLLDEIAKCDVICFNCHSERTYQRAKNAGRWSPRAPFREGFRDTIDRLPPSSDRTHCPQGHEYTPDNIKRGSKGERVCRTCARAATNNWEKRHTRINGKRVPKEATA